jgi:N-hydroxyarylamine O-acetyltransferase
MGASIDLAAYFERVGHAGPWEPTLAVLVDLHRKHPSSIPFEGLDMFLGRPVAIDYQRVQSKLVRCRRGGYGHEQNALCFGVLEAIGFRELPGGCHRTRGVPGR